MADDRGESDPLEALTSKINFKMNLFNDLLAHHREVKQVISGVMKEKESLRQEKERFQQEQHANGEALVAIKEELLSSKNTLAAARDALVASTEEISRQKTYVEFLEKKLQECEAKNNQAEQQCRSVTESIQPRGMQTRSMEMKKRPSERPLGNDADNVELIKKRPRQEVANNPTVRQTSVVSMCDEDDLEAVRDELIKGFLEIDYGGRKLGIKEMGKLSEKAFKTACLGKVPPEKVGVAFYQLYSSWQQRLGDLSWYPFKSVTIDGNCQELVNLDDDKLQDLKRVWGQDAHNAVVTALMEMKEYDRLSDRNIAYELWNYKDGGKATTRECVQYLCNQVKRLSGAKRRNTLRSSGRA